MMSSLSDDRYATQRGRYLAKTTELRKPEAKAVAYAEKGFSSNGISKKLNVSESTVKGYMRRAMALYGLEIMETNLPSEEPPDYEKVRPEYYNKLNDTDREIWIEYVRRHSDKLPQEWMHEILESADMDESA